jgi:hypothetical protein
VVRLSSRLRPQAPRQNGAKKIKKIRKKEREDKKESYVPVGSKRVLCFVGLEMLPIATYNLSTLPSSSP